MATQLMGRWSSVALLGLTFIGLQAAVSQAASGGTLLHTPVSMPFEADIVALSEPTSGGELMFRITVTPLEPLAAVTVRVHSEGNLALGESLDRELRNLVPGNPVSFEGRADILEPGAGSIQLRLQVAVGAEGCGGPDGLRESYALYLLDDGSAVSTGQSSITELRLLRIGGLLTAGVITEDEAKALVENEVLRALPVLEDELEVSALSPRGAVAGVRIDGTARWTDVNGGIHPARAVVVRAFAPGLLFGLNEVANVTTDRSGQFVIELPAGTIGSDPTDLTIRVYSRNLAANVRTPPVLVYFGADTYFRERVFSGVVDGTYLAGETFTTGNADDAGRAFSIADGLLVGSDYMQTVQGARPASIPCNFPRPGSGTVSFYNGSSINIHPSKPFAWDVILHEYGHYLGDLFDFDESPGGPHACSENLVGSRGKDPGTKLSWSEGVATYIGIAAQMVTGTASLGVPLAGDTAYDSISASGGAWNYDVEARDQCVGVSEGSETSVTRALWDLADAAVDGDDEIALGHGALWALIAGNHPVTMSAAWNAAITGRMPREIAGYGKGFAQNRISPSQTSPEDGAVIEAAPPTFEWSKNGLNEFSVVFFDAAFAEVHNTGDLGDVTSWTPDQSTWDAIRAAESPVTWVVQARHTDAPETGTYWSGDRTLGGVDFAFVIDDTGSMSEEIGGVRSALLNFLSGFDPMSTDISFQLTTFKDNVTVRTPTSDLATIQAQVSALSASGGGDCPENSLGGLSQGTAAVRRGGTVLFATDADPRPGGDLGSLIAELQSRGARVNVLLSGTCSGGTSAVEIAAVRSSTEGQPGGTVVPRGAAFVGPIDAYSQIASATGGTFAFVPEVNANPTGQLRYQNTAENILAASVGPRTVLVTPPVLPVGATATVTLRGQNTRFGGNSVASFGDGVEVLAVHAVDPLTIEAEIRVSDAAVLGFRDVEVQTVIAAGVTETASGAGALTLVSRPANASLVSAVPAVVIQGSEVVVELDAIDTSFLAAGTTVSFGSGIVVNALEVVSPTRLRASVSVDTAAVIGFRNVEATTGGVVARPLVASFFRVQARPADVVRLLGVDPAVGRPGQTLDVTLTLEGLEADGDDSVVEITGGGVAVTSVRGCGAVLQATVVIAPEAAPTVRDVIVRAGGRQAVGINAFTVSALSGGDITLLTNQDTMIRATSKHRNEGANPTLRVTGRTTRVLVGFDGSSIPRAGTRRARLVLTIVPGTTLSGLGRGREVSAYPLLPEWVEGNGKALDVRGSQRTRGSGPGATWSCPAAPDVTKRTLACTVPWNGAGPLSAATDTVLHLPGAEGAAEWDVTTDVQNGVSAWVLSLPGSQGRIRYHAREGAPSNEAIPHLVLERE